MEKEKEEEWIRVLEMESSRDGWDEEIMRMDLVFVCHCVSGGRFWIQVQMSGKEEGAILRDIDGV